MATRILGPTGSKKRRRFLLVPVLVAALAAIFLVTGAQAVHDLGTFELEGNAATDHTGTGAPDDWDRVCYQNAVNNGSSATEAATLCGTTTGTNNAKAVAWTAEPDRSSSIFTGGGSKDPGDIDQWAWKDAGGLPDKDNLQHGFAARYTASSPNCVSPPTAGSSCDVLYFGSDRFDNSGDAQQGFWFLQNAISPTTSVKVGGGNGFSTSATSAPLFHKNKDVLVISDFSNGGTTATIAVYLWDTTCLKADKVVADGKCADANLRRAEGSSSALCGGSATDAFCGIVNANTITMPWSFTDKTPTPNNGAINGEFFEAGINLTPLNLGNVCFSTVVDETRSSTSTTAVLKDFVMTPFAPCEAKIETEPSAGVAPNPVSPGTSVFDTARIIGNQVGVFPTGDVTFSLCKYAVAATDATCPVGSGDSIGTGTLSPVANSDATSSADSPKVNCTSNLTGCATGGTFTKNPLAPGHYCFRATWPGDNNYTKALTDIGAAENECFDVSVIATQISTVQFFYPNDTATVQTADSSALPAGTLTFNLYNSSANCNAGTTPGSTGRLLGPITAAIGGGAASSDSASTSNNTVKMPSEATVYWRVDFHVNSDPKYTDSHSTCVENTQYTVGTGDTDTATITNDKTPHS
jgi:hypothetical protein